MKKLGYFLLGIFLILTALAFIIQSPWGTRRAKELITAALGKSGIQFQVKEIQGALPHEVDLTEVKIETDSGILSAEKLRVQISLFRLLRRELAFSHLWGEGISWTEKEKRPLQEGLKQETGKIPFLLKIDQFDLKRVAIPNYGPIDAKGVLKVGKKGRYAFLDTTLTSPDASAHAMVSLRRSGILQMRVDLTQNDLSLKFFAQGPWTSFLDKRGAIQGRLAGEFQTWVFSSRFQRENGSWIFSRMRAKSEFGNISARATVSPDGIASASGEFASKPWSARAELSWKEGSLHIPSYTFQSSSIEATGEFTPSPFTGTSSVKIGQLQELKIPNLFGSAEAEVVWNETAVQIDGTGSNLYWKDFFSESASFHADLLRSDFSGAVSLTLSQVAREALLLETVSLATVLGEEQWPFYLSLNGQWKYPLQLDFSGFWRLQNGNFSLQLDQIEGMFFKHLVSLAAPATFTSSPLRLTPLQLHVGDASLFTSIDPKEVQLTLHHFPIDFLSLNSLDISVTGLIDLDLQLREQEGSFHAAIDQMNVFSLTDSYPMNASGRFEGTYQNNQLRLNGDLSSHSAPLLTFHTSLPVHLEFWPFNATFLSAGAIQGHLAMNGRLEDFLDFFDLGTSRFEGLCRCNLTLGHTLASPTLEGTCSLENGRYQNYFTGTDLQNLSAQISAHGHTVSLLSFTAQDQNEGTFSATGTLDLDLSKRFPFRLAADFSQFNWLQLNLVTAVANGSVQISGNLDRATARGDVEVVQSELTIPDKIPRTFPELEVVYRNPIKPIVPPKPKSKTHYPLSFDLNVTAPRSVFISGRGLSSEWGGSFHLGGTLDALATKGEIDLIKGEFLFSSRAFKLTEGALLFTGAPKEMPYLNLSGSTESKGVTILARLRGPLNNPQLTLQSTPPLPLSSILSLLLFGQDISEINSFQALQLVNSLASIAGEGPDVLEKTRKVLGVDRLRIITVPSKDDEDGNTIAIQVGKYIAEGIIVTFSQGADDNGPNIGVEVELARGFSFQIETQQQQEQGKFSLKWGMNY